VRGWPYIGGGGQRTGDGRRPRPTSARGMASPWWGRGDVCGVASASGGVEAVRAFTRRGRESRRRACLAPALASAGTGPGRARRARFLGWAMPLALGRVGEGGENQGGGLWPDRDGLGWWCMAPSPGHAQEKRGRGKRGGGGPLGFAKRENKRVVKTKE
jgi:hypothetical protein